MRETDLSERGRVFSGRVVVDHLAKTGGQSINYWLRQRLGRGCVTENLVGAHRHLIRRYGGEFSIISGHMNFHGEGLDPRYQYVTCLREPIDRAISWLYYVAGTEPEPVNPLAAAARRFLDTEGLVVDELISKDFNYYVRHFAAVYRAGGRRAEDSVGAAIDTLGHYSVVGLFSRYGEFVSGVADLLDIDMPCEIPYVNANPLRPRLTETSPLLRQRLERYNSADIEFYQELVASIDATTSGAQLARKFDGVLVPYERISENLIASEDILVIDVECPNGAVRVCGEHFELMCLFTLLKYFSKLEIGIHISDQFGGMAFGTNSTLLGVQSELAAPGTYRFRFLLALALPEGRYEVGFALNGMTAEGMVPLVWIDNAVELTVQRKSGDSTVGYMNMPVAFDSFLVFGDSVGCISDARGVLVAWVNDASWVSGGVTSVDIEIENQSGRDWLALWKAPLRVRWTWEIDDFKGSGVLSGFDELELVRAESKMRFQIAVAVPQYVGAVNLRLDCYRTDQEALFERQFHSFRGGVEILWDGSPLTYPAGDGRLRTSVGVLKDGVIAAVGAAGYLLYGPYLRVPPGSYLVSLAGFFPVNEGSVICEVACDAGACVLARSQLTLDANFVEMEFSISRAVADLEVRLWVGQEVMAFINSLRVERQHAS